MEMNGQMVEVFQNEIKHFSVKFTDKEKVRPVSMGASWESDNSYIERTNILKMMEEKLKGEKYNPTEKHVIILSGHGGEGKSELARAYAYNHKDDYEEIFFVPISEEMNSKGSIGPLLELIAKAGYKVDDIGVIDAESGKRRTPFDNLPDNTLLIIDNYNVEDTSFMGEVLNRTGKVDVIFTSRLHTHRKVKEDKLFLYIDEVNEEKSLFCKNLFIKNYELPDEDGEERKVRLEELQDITTICTFTVNNPMLVVLSAAELREYKNRSIHDFAIKIKEGLSEAHLNGSEVYVKRNEGEEISGELPEIVSALFSDLFTYDFSEAELEVLSILMLSPAESINCC